MTFDITQTLQILIWRRKREPGKKEMSLLGRAPACALSAALGGLMQSHTRRALAYIAGRIISGKPSSSVYDYSSSSFSSMSGQVGLANTSVYDYDQGCHVGGNNGNLYHYGDGHHVQLKVNGNEFSGYDYGAGSHFSGRVNGTSISLYDYSSSAYYTYSI